MPSAADLRDKARRARWLSWATMDAAAGEQLQQYAEEFDAKARQGSGGFHALQLVRSVVVFQCSSRASPPARLRRLW
jgi:hypothetical protein